MNNESIIAAGKQYVMNTYGRLPLALVKGEGARVWDADGKVYLDFVSGLAVNSLGHGHPALVQAIQEQAAQLIHVSNLYWIKPQVELAKLLVENSCFDKVFFCNSGAEANEGAIKLARKYAKKHLGEDKFEIITMKKSFHGRTLATLTATGQEKFHQGYSPLPPGFKYVPFNDLQALAEAISPNTCAVMLEPIQGEGGVYPAEQEYLQAVRRWCDEKGLLLIFDEVQTGVGRSGELFAYQTYGVEPDIMTLAKGLAGGVPIGALLAKEQVAAAFQPGDHASTFGGNPLATASGVAVLKTILADGFLPGVKEMSSYFFSKLNELQTKYPVVKEVRGKGLLIGVELHIPAAGVVSACREKGLLVNGVGEKTLRFLPPLIITKADVDEAVAILDEALCQACLED
ncbi:MAG TPA: acetylornithine transaminase [Clostridia bacterium]|nr:acetylornithine transaminase [Clostridia bacterium]